MYLKNTSQSINVVLNTVVGKIAILPQEIIDLEYKLLPPISKHIKQVSKEDYLLFRKEGKQLENEDTQTNTEIVNEDESFVDEQNTEIAEIEDTNIVMEEVQNIVEDISKDISDQDIMSFVKNLLLNKEQVNFEEKGTEPKQDVLQIKETDSEDEKKLLEQQIEQLKETWKSTKAPAKKGKISKQIKELEKQLEKLEKDLQKNVE